MRNVVIGSFIAITGLFFCQYDEAESNTQTAELRKNFLRVNYSESAERRLPANLAFTYRVIGKIAAPKLNNILASRDFRACMIKNAEGMLRTDDQADVENYKNLINTMTDVYRFKWPTYTINFGRAWLNAHTVPTINHFNHYTQIPYISDFEMDTAGSHSQIINFDRDRWLELATHGMGDRENFSKVLTQFLATKIFYERKFPTAKSKDKPASFGNRVITCVGKTYR
ncbi:MAG: hypothetical protein QTN59_18650 [Candidatus Electrothrix communis]|nr:MAG: hypothetical protein QTN59_18650 [Candidatus Electrothrix communis]